MEEYRECREPQHNNLGSEYPKERVPIKFFLKDPDDFESDILKACIVCRNYATKMRKNGKLRRDIKLKEIWDADGEFLACNVNIHGKNSKHPWDKVPRELFLKDPRDPKSYVIKTCLDCRKDRVEYTVKNNARKLEKVKDMPNHFICSSCHQIRHEDVRAIKPDGTPAASCITCKKLKQINRVKKNEAMREVLFNRALEQKSCCLRCQKIFIFMEGNDNVIITFEPVIVHGSRKAKYGNYITDPLMLLIKYSAHICYDIMVFDHLTEEEQRERGILKPDEKYVPKVHGVGAMTSKQAKEREAEKCQLLCVKCHMLETIAREVKGPNMTGEIGVRRQIINDLKAKGCANCKCVHPNAPRLFEMDHLDPEQKLTEVSVMVVDTQFTMEQFHAEIAKCQVLCLHCHKLNTRNQRRLGII